MLALRLRRTATALAGPSRVLYSAQATATAGPSRLVRGEPSNRGLHSTSASAAKKPVTRSSMTASQRKAFAKQQVLARAMAAGESAASRGAPIPQPTQHGAGDGGGGVGVSASASASMPAVQDLLAMKPEKRPRPREAGYADEHAALVERLDGAFVRAQVVELARALGLAPKHRESKVSVVQKILDSWGWVVPSEADVGVWTRHIPMTTAQMFLLQRDAEVAAWLERLRRVDVAVEAGATPGTYVVVARGPRRKLDALEDFLSEHKTAYASTEWPIGDMAGLSPSDKSLWAVSTATGAYVEPVGWTKYRATGPSTAAACRARDMLLRAARRAHAPSPPLAAVVPTPDAGASGPEYVALVPHMPAASSALRWTTEMLAADRPLFRLARVSAPTVSPGERELAHRNAHMDGARVRPLSSSAQGADTLAEAVQAALVGADMAGAADATKAVTFQFGHLLAPGAAVRDADAGAGAGADASTALTHSIAGAWPLDDPATMWLRLSTPIFSPAVPPGLIRFPPAGTLRRYRRVTYTADGLSLVAEYAYPAEAEAEAAPEAADDRPWIVALDAQLAAARQAAQQAGHAEVEHGDDYAGSLPDSPDAAPFDFGAVQNMIAENPARAHPLVVTAHLGKRARRDVLVPDRPIDIRVAAEATRDIEPPAELSTFFTDLHNHAEDAGAVSLADLETLRTGRGVARPIAREEAVVDTEMWDEDDMGVEEDMPAAPVRREFGLRQVDDAAEAAAEAETESETALPAIVPPRTLDVGGTQFTLEADEVVEVVESSVAMAGATAAPATLRTLAVADLLGPGGVYRYAELRAPVPSPDGVVSDAASAPVDAGVWRELANATREVPPLARAAPLPF